MGILFDGFMGTFSSEAVLRIRIRDPLPRRDPGWITWYLGEHKNQYFEVQFYEQYPGSGMRKICIRDKHPGSATLQ